MAEGLTSNEPCRMMSHWFCDSRNMTKPQHFGHTLPWGSPPNPHNSMTPEVDQGTQAQLDTASSDEIRFVEVAGQHHRTELETQVAGHEERGNTDLRLTDSLLIWMLANEK